MSGKTWRDKANKEIEKMCFAAWKAANTKKNGQRYKKNRQYVVPELAEKLVKCLEEDDEETAKSIFVWELIR